MASETKPDRALTFYAPASRAAALGLGTVSGLACLLVATRLWSLSSLLAIAVGLAGLYITIRYGVALRNLSRPLIELSEEGVIHRPLLGLSARQWSRGDVEGIAENDPKRVVLRIRSGEREVIPLQWLAESERPAARTAIESWVAERARTPGRAG